ncbi:thiamine pyrophosphate-dependent enzyme [Orrella daihaiensis]|uniref:Pyruvate decarboxylase n=1 Tax=Orrella daihaiensis TaxID=2782176 RepID=A0ABY4AJP3_9BURK|nr:thiamine pyrophosphate-dependent enzyme [Orrella daihaiensis]UOD49886.1 pyruvate decarboxylase [Orrella daihaiensis]
MQHNYTSSHALINALHQAGIDRAFLVPGESYLGILDAMVDFPKLDVVTCRHEAGAAFMAIADGRLTNLPGVALVSRGPGASNAAIAVHTAQQDAIPFILLIGQIAEKDLRREAFQEIDYQKMFGGIAKWVFECRHPEQLGETAAKAVRVATSGTPGPVVIVLPEDIQQQPVAKNPAPFVRSVTGTPAANTLSEVRQALANAKRPLILAGGVFEQPGGRQALQSFAESFNIPVVVTFRRQDLFDNTHPLYGGNMGLANPPEQMALLEQTDLLLALGTRLGDITTQNYAFPTYARTKQTFLHAHPDSRIVGWDTAADFPLVCDPIDLAGSLAAEGPKQVSTDPTWLQSWQTFREQYMEWPSFEQRDDGVEFAEVVKAISDMADKNLTICLDAGTFAAPVYRHVPFTPGRRLMSPLSGAMGYGTPAAMACALRDPTREIVCMVGDGGMLMTGQEMILAVERKLPVLMVVSSNGTYGSIRKHQEQHYPGRISGTSLFNPDFVAMAKSYGMPAWRIETQHQIREIISQARDHIRSQSGPALIDVKTNLKAIKD